MKLLIGLICYVLFSVGLGCWLKRCRERDERRQRLEDRLRFVRDGSPWWHEQAEMRAVQKAIERDEDQMWHGAA